MNKKPVVWVFNQFAGTPESGWGERHFYFSQYWIKEGWDVVIFSGSFNHVFKKNVAVEKGTLKEEMYEGVRFVWVKNPIYKAQSAMRFLSMLVFSFRLFNISTERFGTPTAIIVSSMPIFPILPALYHRMRTKSRVIFEIRDIWPLTLMELGGVKSWHPLVQFISWYERIAYRYANAVVSLLPNALDHIEEVAQKKVDFHYIPNGIDPVLVGDEEIPDDLKSIIPSDKFVVGYAGTLGLANALEHFIDAAIALAKDKSIFFLIVGDGYLSDTLKQQCSGISNIQFYPKIRKSQIQNLLTFFDVAFVGRSGSNLFRHGVSANKYFDYMLAAKPVLDSNNLIKDPVELSGCGIIVEPDSAVAIEEGIRQFMRMESGEMRKMGEKGKYYVTEKHAISNLAIDYIGIFTK